MSCAHSQQQGGKVTLQRPLVDHTNRATHKDPLGKPCLDVEAGARSNKANANVYSHIISVQNKCAITIMFRLCYSDSKRCLDLVALPYKRVDGMLGVQPGMREFRYEIFEKF